MTKTGQQTSISPTTTPDGRPGFRVECRCSTHPEGKSVAIVADNGQPYPTSHIHGAVLGAHHPAIGKALVRRGIWAA